EAGAREVLGGGDLEAATRLDSGSAGTPPRFGHRFGVVIEAGERGGWKGLRHQDGRGAVPTTHIRDACAGGKFRLHTVKGRQPVLDQVGQVAGAIEALDAMEHAMLVFVPADALAGAEGLGGAVEDASGCQRGLEAAGDEGGAV